MSVLAVKENIKPNGSKSGLDWRENTAVQKLLDVVVSIIAEEAGFRPYYMIHTKIQTLALLDDSHKGLNPEFVLGFGIRHKISLYFHKKILKYQ